ncbi:MAG TPA: hypothetical protein VMX17_15600 [Candidatus Glassbacteria bacterium]|nr:hypothetical protein [Candidatus Glassbacteria bacterium]
MKDKIIDLTITLASEGFTIAEMEVEGSDLVRIKFANHQGLELVVNSSEAKIIEGSCSGKILQNLIKLVKKQYAIKDHVESIDQDMFNKLLLGK